MNKITSIENAVATGEQFVKWVEEEVIPALLSTQEPSARAVLELLRGLHPFSPIPGVHLSTDVSTATLYKLQGTMWLSEGIIRAFCERLQVAHESVRYTDLLNAPRLNPKARNSTSGEKFDALAAQVTWLVDEEDVQHVFVPINLYCAHWVCVIVDTKAKFISHYDPLGKGGEPAKRAESIASAIQEKMASYTIRSLNNPTQEDSYSCGLFVCMKFWRTADPSVSKVMTAHHLIRRRFELLHFILTGEKAQ